MCKQESFLRNAKQVIQITTICTNSHYNYSEILHTFILLNKYNIFNHNYKCFNEDASHKEWRTKQI